MPLKLPPLIPSGTSERRLTGMAPSRVVRPLGEGNTISSPRSPGCEGVRTVAMNVAERPGAIVLEEGETLPLEAKAELVAVSCSGP